MKEIINVYGEFILESLVIVMLFLHIFVGIRDENGNSGVLQMIGSNLTVGDVNHLSYIDFDEGYREECSKNIPQIQFLGTHLDIGIHKVSDMFVAYDYAGRSLPITIKSIRDVNGTDLLINYDISSDEIYFSKEGIYTLELETMDSDFRILECKICIPVCARE